jgi:hypothetical protein
MNLNHWGWRRLVPSKRWLPLAQQRGVTPRKTGRFNYIAVWTPQLTNLKIMNFGYREGMTMESRSSPRQARREANGTVSKPLCTVIPNTAGVCTVLAGQTSDWQVFPGNTAGVCTVLAGQTNDWHSLSCQLCRCRTALGGPQAMHNLSW